MAPRSTVLHRRRLRGLAAAGCAALVLPLLAAAPAAAQTTTTTTTRTAETDAAAVRLMVNLPQGNAIQLDIDPVAGTVTSVTGRGPEATAIATLIRGSIAGQVQSFPGAEARLPEPKQSSGPTSALSAGIAGSPLSQFLAVGVATATASVSEAPSSASSASIANLGVGLPAALNAALQQLLAPLLAGVDQLLAGLAPIDGARQVCTALTPVTVPLTGGVGGVPALGPLLQDVVRGTLSPEGGVLCNLRAFLIELRTTLGTSLADLSAPGGLIGTGLLTASQSITTEGSRTTARATAEVANLRLLGQNPFGNVAALRTTSTAFVDGTTADATIDKVAVDAFARPLLTLRTNLEEVTGNLTGINLAGLTGVLAQIQTVLDGLAGIGVRAGPLDAADPVLQACPEQLAGQQLTGTFEAPGACAAAAARGYGIAVTAPAQLATPLGIAGPLVALQFAPTAAVVRSSSTTSTTPAPPAAAPVVPAQPRSLPRTGAEAPVAAVGLALLVGAALVRRRRAAAEL